MIGPDPPGRSRPSPGPLRGEDEPGVDPLDRDGGPGGGGRGARCRGSDRRRPPGLGLTGRGVVVGVVDWGCDFAHLDFRHDDGRTRLLALWDQRSGARPGSPEPYGYGVVHTAAAIDRALAAADPYPGFLTPPRGIGISQDKKRAWANTLSDRLFAGYRSQVITAPSLGEPIVCVVRNPGYAALGYHPADADPGPGAHGTHVLGIAAGNGRSGAPAGVAPGSDLVFVHLATWGPRGIEHLGDSVTLLEAIDFILRLAARRPCVINLSMGRHGESHDGTTLVEQGLDAALRAAPGRAICQSAGNYYTRRIHASGQLRPAEERVLPWDIDEVVVRHEELELWYPGRDTLEVVVRPPGGPVRLSVKDKLPL